MNIVTFPDGAWCSEQQHSEYVELEKRWLPRIERKARRLEHLPGVDRDDLVQTGRAALLRALMHHEQAEGSLDNLVSVSLRNAFNEMAARTRAPSKLPWACVRESNDVWAMKPLNEASLNQCKIDPGDESLNQAEALEQRDAGEFVLKVCSELLQELPTDQAKLLQNRLDRANGSQAQSGLSQRRETYLLRESPRSIVSRFNFKARGQL